jgi:spore germination protein (amino acid permease)
MSEKSDKISTRQLTFMVIQAQIGVGVLSLPYNVALIAENDSWISILVAGLIIQIIILVMWLLAREYSNLTLFDICTEILGKYLGKLIILCYCGYLMLQGGFLLAKYSQILDRWMLPGTPNWIMIMLLVLTSAYVVKDSLKSIASFFVLVTPLLIILFGLISYTLKDANLFYLLPVGVTGPVKIFEGSQEAMFSMIGSDLLFFIYPYVYGTNKGKLKAVTWANVFVTLFYSYLVAVSLVCFLSPYDLNHIPETFIYLIKAYSFKIIERMDLIFLPIWIICVATTFMYFIYITSNGLAGIFKGKSHRAYLLFVCIITFGIAILLSREEYIQFINTYINYSHYIFQMIIPAILLLATLVWSKHKRKEQLSNESS